MRLFAPREAETRQAERLDQYFRSLASGATAPPAELDDGLAATARRLATLASVGPRPEFTAALARGLDHEASRRAASADSRAARLSTEVVTRSTKPAPPLRARHTLGRALTGAVWLVPVAAVLLLTFVAGRPLVDRLSRQPATSGPTSMTADPALDGSEWTLETIGDVPPVEGTSVTLRVHGRDAEGSAGCNSYSARGLFGNQGELLQPEALSVTVALCSTPEGVMSQEAAFIEALRSASAYQVSDDRLVLNDASGMTVLTLLRRQPLVMDPTDLIGTSWLLQSMGDDSVAEAGITLTFSERQVSGSAGCRDYVAQYEASGDTITFPLIEMKDTGCTPADELVRQEGRFTDALSRVHYNLNGERLEFRSERGETLAFVRLAAEVVTPSLPAPSSIRGLRLVQESRVSSGDLRGADGTEQTVLERTRFWYQAPNLWRGEYEQILVDDGGERRSTALLTLSDGNTLWDYSAEEKSVTAQVVSPEYTPVGAYYVNGEVAASLDAVLAATSECGTPKVVGEAVIAGRNAYEIDLGPNLCPPAGLPEMNGRQVLWVDQDTLITLKQVLYSSDGAATIVSTEITEIEYDGDMDPALFVFTPPDGATVLDWRPRPAPSRGEYEQQLADVAARVDFPLLVPGSIPGNLLPRRPLLLPGSPDGQQVQLSYTPVDEVELDTSAIQHGFTIVQQRATYESVVSWSEGAQPAEIHQGRAWLRRGTTYVDGTGRDSAAIVLRDGTLLSISSLSLEPEALLALAASLQPVAGGHEALPEPTPPTLAEVRAATAHPVFVPTWVPDGLTAEPPLYTQIIYHRGDGSVGLTVANFEAGTGPSFGPESSIGDSASTAVTLPDGSTAYYVDGVSRGDNALSCEREGTGILLTSPDLSREDLVRVAASLSSSAELATVEPVTPRPTPTAAPTPTRILMPRWLPAEMTTRQQVEGQVVTIGYDPHPEDDPHDVLVFRQTPASAIDDGDQTPDPRQTVETIGRHEVTVIHRGGGCVLYSWEVEGLRLTLTNAYDPPGTLRYTCEEMAKIVESVR